GAEEAIEKIAPLYGKNVEEFYKMSEKQIISVEAAGAGFAAAIAQAEKYRGQEIGSIQALMDVGIELQEEEKTNKKILTEEEKKQALSLIRKIETTLREQSEGWKQRPIFERQWVLRDFRKNTGASVEQFLEVFKKLEHSLINNEFSSDILKKLQINKLSKYYEHQIDLLKGYEKDQEKLKKNMEIIKGWINTILTFEEIFRGEIR
ncbi:MAG: SDR family NAD(P)-dependent oxidoreductase, partial [Candidatus Atribacteria bacterium]|nr:SDR family NAD(P)-dependent oxidoreductase [Candidatus Atribacteria bacterium]